MVNNIVSIQRTRMPVSKCIINEIVTMQLLTEVIDIFRIVAERLLNTWDVRVPRRGSGFLTLLCPVTITVEL